MPATPFAASTLITGSGAKLIRGFSIAETSGTASAYVRIRDGKNASGNLIITISLSANQSVRELYDPGTLEIVPSAAIYLEVVSGTVEGSVWWE